MYDTPLTRPTTVGGLLGNAVRGTGQVAQAGGGIPLRNYLLGPRSLDMLDARNRPTSDLATTLVAPSPMSLLSPQQVAMRQPAFAPPSQLSNVATSPQLSGIAPPPARPNFSSDSNSSGLLGRIGSGLSGAASELGGLFDGEEGQARARALSKSLLRGPSRTPISFGQSIAEGLSAGGEEIEAQEKRKYLKEQMQEKRSESKARKEFRDAVKTGDDDKVEKAFKKAYPLEWRQSKAKKQTISDLKADAIRAVARADANKTPRSDLPPSTIDLYNAATSTGGGPLAGLIGSSPSAPLVSKPEPTYKTLQQQAAEEFARRAALKGQ